MSFIFLLFGILFPGTNLSRLFMSASSHIGCIPLTVLTSNATCTAKYSSLGESQLVLNREADIQTYSDQAKPVVRTNTVNAGLC